MAAGRSERHLSHDQSERITAFLKPHAMEFSVSVTVAAAETPEARGYAREIMTSINLAGIPMDTPLNYLLPRDMKAFGQVSGVFIQVKDPNHPPFLAVILKDALEKGDMHVTYWPNMDFGEENYTVTVGLLP